MKKIIFIFISVLLVNNIANAQGCVAIKSNGGYCSMGQRDTTKWSVSVNNRYYNSYKHFVGTEEQKQRVEQGTQVINHSWTTDFLITRKLKNRWSISMNLPIVSNTRSSLYEHDGKTRHTTSSFGVGDVRLSISKWLLNEHKRGNIQVGLGLKLATGDFKVQDYFFVNDSTNSLGPVDQSIQLGDGGTGITFELNSFYNLSKKLSWYGNFYYLLSSKEQNGVSTTRGKVTTASAIKYTTDVMSVPDQFMFRTGVNYKTKAYTFSLGVREECLPSADLIGGSRGFRRPGYIISVEPGVSYAKGNTTVYLFMPYAVKRDRTQSYADKLQTEVTGVYRQGDAAFADYAINIGATFSF